MDDSTQSTKHEMGAKVRSFFTRSLERNFWILMNNLPPYMVPSKE